MLAEQIRLVLELSKLANQSSKCVHIYVRVSRAHVRMCVCALTRARIMFNSKHRARTIEALRNAPTLACARVVRESPSSELDQSSVDPERKAGFPKT